MVMHKSATRQTFPCNPIKLRAWNSRELLPVTGAEAARRPAERAQRIIRWAHLTVMWRICMANENSKELEQLRAFVHLHKCP